MNKEEILRKRNIEFQKEVETLKKQLAEVKEDMKIIDQFNKLIEKVKAQSAELELMIDEEKHINQQVFDHYKEHGFKIPFLTRIKMRLARRTKK